MRDHRETNRPRPWLRLIRLISWIVPRRLRADWRQEWEAELRHHESLLGAWRRGRGELLRHSLGSLRDALWLQPKRLEDEMFQDLRYGVRLLLKSKVFTMVAVLSLALGIGANTVVFSALDAVLLKMLPVKEPEQLVLFRWLSGEKKMLNSFSGNQTRDEATGLQTSTSFSYPAFAQFRAQNQSLAEVFAFAHLRQVNVNVDGQAEIVAGQIVSVGKVIYLNNTAFTVAGVTPPEFYGAFGAARASDFAIPMAFLSQAMPAGGWSLSDPTNWWVRGIMGRLKPGVSVEQAQANLNLTLQQHASELRKSFTDQRDLPQLKLTPGGQGLTESRRSFSQPLFVLMTAVGLVLLVACLNVASLLLARAATRRKEIAVRMAAGAGRWRLIRQLLTESVLLASFGGALGLVFAYWGKDALLALIGPALSLNLKLDLRVLGFTAAVSALTGIAFGLAPALRATRIDLISALKDGGGGAGPVRSRLSKGLIVAQVALSLVLLVGAGLFVRTLRNLTQVEVGFNRENLLLFTVNPPTIGYEGSRLAALYRQINARIETIPGVRSATLSDKALLGGGVSASGISVPGYTPQPGEEMSVPRLRVGTNFFATMEIPILLGRCLTPLDGEQAPAVAVINQAMARRYFANDNPVGRHFSFGRGQVEIVGVARDASYQSLQEEIRPTIYIPYLQNLPAQMSYAVRTVGDPNALAPAIRDAVRSIDPNLPLFAVKTQNAQIAELLTQSRLFAGLSSFFGLLALALVSIGLYGVMSYIVARRTHEIGVRLALGAQGRDVRRMVLGESLRLALLGVAIGVPAALATTRSISGQLFRLAPNDPLTMAAATLLLLAVAACAGYLPARRAARVDPMAALRHE